MRPPRAVWPLEAGFVPAVAPEWVPSAVDSLELCVAPDVPDGAVAEPPTPDAGRDEAVVDPVPDPAAADDARGEPAVVGPAEPDVLTPGEEAELPLEVEEPGEDVWANASGAPRMSAAKAAPCKK